MASNMHGSVDAAAIIRLFGGRTDLHAKIERRGYEISIRGIDKWRERESITPGWLRVLAEIARDEGREFDPLQFVRMPRVAEPAQSADLDFMG